ncbi:MAG: BNR-4 repeat-containing protein, partial [SAR324 cluster bacterium]|nr:BNR-4 repeat-containing protein [SAR324 cluster bacterium]
HSHNPKGIVENRNVDLVVSLGNLQEWFTHQDHPLRLPITPANSPTILAIQPVSNLSHQNGMALDARGNPHIAYIANDAQGVIQIHHAWFDGTAWQISIITQCRQPYVMQGIGSLSSPISRPGVLVASNGIVYVVYGTENADGRMVVRLLEPTDYRVQSGNLRVLWSEPVGRAEPVLDTERWKADSILSMLIQFNDQPQGGAKNVKADFAPVYLVDWDLSNW